MSKSVLRSVAATAILLILGASQLPAQSDELAMRLLVMIKAGSSVGAGIICGLDARGAYIATADHVARPGMAPVPVSVKFYNQQDREVRAEILNNRDADLDIAVIRVSSSVPFWRELRNLPFHQKADLSLLKRGSEVYLLGNPGGRSWRMSVRPETLAQIRGDLLEFESNLITGGHSGGALLTQGLNIAGMLRSDNPPYGEAVSIDRILERFKRWGYPADLNLPLPRITMGEDTNCQLQPSGEARCWSVRGEGPDSGPVVGFRFLDISAGYNHICGIDTGGKAACWGNNQSGQLGVGNISEEPQDTPLPVAGALRFGSISAGWRHTCALDKEGRAHCWGGGREGRLGNDSGEPSYSPVAVAGGLRFQSISAGSYHTCGVTENGDLYCWGGILGSGKARSGTDAPNAFAPLRVATTARFRTVSAGRDLSCAVSVDGDGYCWGSGENANVNGWPLRTSLEIVRVPGRLKFKSISAGPADHACGVTTESRVFCWGGNEFGQLGDGTKEDSVIPVAVATDVLFDSVNAGFQQSCGVSAGSIYCWGRKEGTDAQTTPPAPPPNAGSTVAGKVLKRYMQSPGSETEKPPVAWKGTLEHPLSGLPQDCGPADVEFLRQPGGGYTLQLKCRVSANKNLSVTLKSADGAKSLTGQMAGQTVGALATDDLDQWSAALDRQIPLFTEALAYPAFVAMTIARGQETAVEFTHLSGRIDELHFDTGSGRLVYLSAIPAKGKPTHLEISFDQYRQVDGVNVPFEVRLNTKEEQSVLKLREIRFPDQ